MGDVLAIYADGLCAYYVIGAVLRLCQDASFLSGGWVPCKDLLASARSHELANFSKWVSSISRSGDELHEAVANVTGGSVLDFQARVSGVTKGENLNGDQLDFAFGTLYQDVRIMVVDADRIFATSTEEELLASCEPNFFPGEAAKTKVVFAILSGRHFSIGSVRTHLGFRAVFEVGTDCDESLRLVLRFIRSRAPSSPAQVRGTH